MQGPRIVSRLIYPLQHPSIPARLGCFGVVSVISYQLSLDILLCVSRHHRRRRLKRERSTWLEIVDGELDTSSACVCLFSGYCCRSFSRNELSPRDAMSFSAHGGPPVKRLLLTDRLSHFCLASILSSLQGHLLPGHDDCPNSMEQAFATLGNLAARVFTRC